MSDHKLKNIINSSLENTTLTEGIKVVDNADATTYDNYRTKALGLQLVLFGLAEVQSLRVRHLSMIVYEIEKQLFNRQTITELDPNRLIELYRSAVQGLTDSSSYIKSTLSSINWADVEAQLALLSSKSNTPGLEKGDSENISKVADELLRQISQSLGGNGPKKD